MSGLLIRPPESPAIEGLLVFLAGPIQGARWQVEAAHWAEQRLSRIEALFDTCVPLLFSGLFTLWGVVCVLRRKYEDFSDWHVLHAKTVWRSRRRSR
jgi:hypothetical protein